VLQTLTGMGLATSAGLNAYIPLLMVGLLGRFTDLITLPQSWHWLENGWVLTILTMLLAVEFVADKIPLIDHANDVVQTLVRPTSGGLVFGAASSAHTGAVSDPGQFFTSHQWVPIIAGILISFTVHSVKAAARPVINASTAGFGAPVASTIEDTISLATSAIAIIVPILVLGVILLFIIWVILVLRWRRRRKLAKAAKMAARQRAAAAAHQGTTRTIDLWN
jgi:Domain of unknown function (DUF4126)